MPKKQLFMNMIMPNKMYIQSNYNFRWKFQYIPSYYEDISEEQKQINNIVLDFKNGVTNEDTMSWFCRTIWNITKKDDYSWSVCFMPCSSKETYEIRFGRLAEYLKENTRVDIYLSTYGFINDHSPSHREGKSKINKNDIAINVEHIYNKNIILIDDIITTGETFNAVANMTMFAGARTVLGLFLAKTIHPRHLKKKSGITAKEAEDLILEEEAETLRRLNLDT